MNAKSIDTDFYDMSFDEFEAFIENCNEVEIPLESFNDFVDELSGRDTWLREEVIDKLAQCVELADSGKYSEAFFRASQLQSVLPSEYYSNLYQLYDRCALHGVIQASEIIADYHFSRWSSDSNTRESAFKYLLQLYNRGVLPYFWKTGYCYLNGLGTEKDVDKAKDIFIDGLLYYGDKRCGMSLRQVVPISYNALENAISYYLGIECSRNLEKSFSFFLNAVIHGKNYIGFCLARLADIMMETAIDGSSARKIMLLYKAAIKHGLEDIPKIDNTFSEGNVYYNLGIGYYDGYGVRTDYYKAAVYLDYSKWLLEDGDRRLDTIENVISQAYSKAESLINDDFVGEYYRKCFEEGDPIMDDEWVVDKDDDFLILQ